MWARIESGTVRELIDFDPAGRFHASLVFVPCPEGTEQGDLFDEQAGTFSKPPAPPAPPPPVLTCTPRQFKQALELSGLYDAAETYALTGPRMRKLWWLESLSFERDNAELLTAAAALGKTEAELDALFALARSL
jgi:hypothetical protein